MYEKRGYHDIGGNPNKASPVSTAAGTPPVYATLTDALRSAIGDRYRLHEQRRKIEEMGEELYDRVTYYEIRVLALKDVAIEKGMVTEAELERRMAEIRKREGQG